MYVEVALPLPINSLFTYKVTENFRPKVQIGQSVMVPFKNRFIKGIVVRFVSEDLRFDPGLVKEIHSVPEGIPPVPHFQMELTRWISKQYGCSWGESLSLIMASQKQVSKRARKKEETGFHAEEVIEELKESKDLELTEEQARVLIQIDALLLENEPKKFLLFGVTSSGKTLIYMEFIQRILSRNKQVLFLVPEISLCAPFFEVLRKRFGNRVGVWHSQVSPKDKKQLLERMKKGELSIIVGARSSLFVSFTDLGLIVIDEEHDLSYKQDEKPRYHAREVALKLA